MRTLIATMRCFLASIALTTPLGAVEITGKVESVSGDQATIQMKGDLAPNIGDRVDIFFKMAGLDEEIAVANGKVAVVSAEGIEVKIDEATATVAKDQLVRITSPAASKKITAAPKVPPLPATPTPTASDTTTVEPIDVGQMASKTVTFDELKTGPLPMDAFTQHGILLKKGKGAPGVYAVEPNMLPPPPCQKVMLIGGEKVTAITILLDPPVKRFALYRIGTANGASTPTWTMTAYDRSGKVIGSRGEEHGLPNQPTYFGVDGEGITRVVLTTDNRYGSGTWATWNSLPIAGFGFDR